MLWVVALGFFMQTLDTSIVNTALPSMAQSLGESPLHMQAVVFSYSLMMAVMVPASGWLADRFGTQRIYLFAICVFTIGSLFCAASPNLTFLICSRAIQGFGGSMMLPVGRLAVLRNFPGDGFLPAMSIVTVAGLVGPLMGPTLGGLLCEVASWHWIFLINIPVGLAGATATLAYMPNDRLIGVERFDVIGYFLLAVAMLASSLSLDGFEGGLTPMTTALAFAGALSLFVYIRYAMTAASPLFNLRIFSITSFRIGLSGNFFARLGNSAMPYLLPLFMQTCMGYSPLRAGMMLLPSTIAGMLAKNPATRLIQRCGYRRILVINTTLVGAAMASFTLLKEDAPTWELSILMLFFGAVNSIQFTAMNTFTLKDLPERDAGSGNSMLSIVQMLALGISVVIATIMLGVFQGAFSAENLPAAFHAAFAFIGVITAMSSAIFSRA
jgi:EmrB/QacA subfamily drug resistance transporter